jgi:hypothetical protein
MGPLAQRGSGHGGARRAWAGRLASVPMHACTGAGVVPTTPRARSEHAREPPQPRQRAPPAARGAPGRACDARDLVHAREQVAGQVQHLQRAQALQAGRRADGVALRTDGKMLSCTVAATPPGPAATGLIVRVARAFLHIFCELQRANAGVV